MPIHRSTEKNGYNPNLQFDTTSTNKNNEKNKAKRESGKLHCQPPPPFLLLMLPQMLRKPS